MSKVSGSLKLKEKVSFLARLVACGYSKMPGVNFSENHSPVLHDITYHLILAMIIIGLSVHTIDVKTAFLLNIPGTLRRPQLDY